jgi:hypothetical protein
MVGCGTARAQPAATQPSEAVRPHPAAATQPRDVVVPGDTPDSPILFTDALELRNDQYVVRVSPGTGRIVHFGRPGGENLLWIMPTRALDGGHPQRDGRPYFNFGGDKIWPLVQALWPRAYGGRGGWPPDNVVDGGMWQIPPRAAAASAGPRLAMQSPLQPALGSVLLRELFLFDDLEITNRVQRTQPSPFPVHLWSVTQVQSPPYVLMDQQPDRPTEDAFATFGNDRDAAEDVEVLEGLNALRWRFDHEGGGKAGSYGHWLAAIYPADDLLFVQWHDSYDPQGMYPDDSNLQVYKDGTYTELELLSPSEHLQQGESLETRVMWQLMRIDGRSDAELIAAIRQMIRE